MTLIKIPLRSKDELAVKSNKAYLLGSDYINIQSWDDYEGRGCSIVVYTDEVDELIEVLKEFRKEMN